MEGILRIALVSRWRMDPIEFADKRLFDLRHELEHVRQGSVGYEQQAEESKLLLKYATPIERYALEKSIAGYAETAMHAYNLTKEKKLKNPLFIAMENIYPESYGGHPTELKELVLEELKLNPSVKMIVFANYRDTIDNIIHELKKMNVKCTKLIGQKAGLTQKEQISTVNDFKESEANILIGTQILEEGLDVPGGIDVAMFYEPISSELRRVQRMGRVARIKAGKIIFLITKDTRDEAYFWASYHKERKMNKILYGLKKKNLQDFF